MNEIKMEKKAQRKLTPPAGYEAETDGALAILKRKFEDGTHVHILMSVSGSLSPERAVSREEVIRTGEFAEQNLPVSKHESEH